MDEISSKYMLPLGGMLTAVFILFKWGGPSFIDEFYLGTTKRLFSETTVKVLYFIASSVVGFIILNELIGYFTGTPLIG